MKDHQREFLDFALAEGALRFGDFTLKSGRQSPYFFNTGMFQTGRSLGLLGAAYARAIVESGIEFDMLFGPAYKGIPLVAATAIALASAHGRDLPYAFNRKEAKKYAEGGVVVGAALRGRVLILDDVISAGLSVGESCQIIRAAGAEPAGLFVALDRQERGEHGTGSAADQVRAEQGITVASIASLASLVEYIAQRPELAAHLGAIRAYSARYGSA